MHGFWPILPVYLALYSRSHAHITRLCNLSALIQQALIRLYCECLPHGTGKNFDLWLSTTILWLLWHTKGFHPHERWLAMVPISRVLQRRALQHQLPAHLLLVKYRSRFRFHLVRAGTLVVFHRISNWTELITHWFFADSLLDKACSPEFCVINCVLLLMCP